MKDRHFHQLFFFKKPSPPVRRKSFFLSMPAGCTIILIIAIANTLINQNYYTYTNTLKTS